jgi:hypothetical protein
MAGIATKAANSAFYKARMAARERNEMLSSREGASEVMGIDRTRLARIELGTITPYPEEVVMMADVYNAPELMNYCCTHECPIGRRIITQAGLEQLDRMTINILDAVQSVQGVNAVVLNIASDGQVTDDEIPRLQEVLQSLQKVSKAATELQIWMDKLKGLKP